MLDAVGILIGLVTVILVLSIVSTSLVQMTSSLLRLRGRNLFRGVERLLLAAAEAGGIEEGKMDSKELVEKVCSSSGLLEIGRSWLPAKAPRWLSGPSRSWIGREELKEILDGMSGLTKEFKDKVDELFPRLEALTKKRFGFFMRVVSIIWAVVIAVAFQVSAPKLLHDLSVDPELRKLAVESAGEIGALRDVGAEALEKLGAEREDLVTVLAQVESAGPGETAPIVEVRKALSGRDDAEEIVGRYAEIVLELKQEQIEDSMRTLGKLDIGLWGQGNRFYWTTSAGALDVEWGNVGGVLMTAALLSLGAPFWFQMLQKLSGLRDALSIGKEEKKSNGNDGDSRSGNTPAGSSTSPQTQGGS